MNPEQRDYLRGMIMGLLGLAGLGLTIAAGRKSGHDWVPTETEAKAIAEPLTNIAWRHGPDELNEATDLVDGIAVAAAGGMYAVRAMSGEPGGSPALPSPAPAADPTKLEEHP